MSEPMRWFPLYVDRFLTSKRVRRMNAEHVGVYFLLLCEQWDNGTISDEDADLELVARAPVPVVRDVLKACFHRTRKGWKNDTLEEVRAEQEAKLKRLKVAGAAGAEARWHKGKNGNRMRKPKRPQSDPNAIRSRLEESREEERESTSARAHEASPEDPNPDFDGYTPTDTQRARALELGVGLDTAVRKWRAHRKANDLRPADMVADFDGWLENEPGFSKNGNGAHPPDTGIVRRFEPAPQDDGPAPDPELRRAGLELVKQAVAATRSAPAVDPKIDDPERIAARAAERDRQIAALGKAKP